MKALTVKNPWAWAIFHGKGVENRKTRTNYRGPLAIHAGLTWSGRGESDPRILAAHRPYENPLQAHRVRIERADHNGCCFVFGMVIGTVEVTDCHLAVEECCGPWGDDPGCYHWVLTKPHELVTPVPCRGRLGVFDLPDPVTRVIDAHVPNRGRLSDAKGDSPITDSELDRYLVEGLGSVPDDVALVVADDDGLHGWLDSPTD